MIRMGIGMMSMVMVVAMLMIVTIMMMMVRPCTNTFDVMMVTFLRKPNLCFKPKHLIPIFAELAVHLIPSIYDFIHPFRKCIEHQWMAV